MAALEMSQRTLPRKLLVQSKIKSDDFMNSPKEIGETSVIGAGVMGTGLAITIALNGIRVFLNDLTEDLLRASSKRISDLLADLEKRGLIASAARIQENVVIEKDIKKAVENSDMVFEAITEDLSAKKIEIRSSEVFEVSKKVREEGKEETGPVEEEESEAGMA